MTQDEIIELAKQTGLFEVTKDGYEVFYPDNLEPFAKLVAAKERVRFANECIDLVASYGGPVDLEAAIRARGEA